ncbi:MAG: hypothetical protein Q4E53_01415 [Eubacteriales bacterium]|nr:hypothetical protein [Eubacteriales bacterium]
MLNELFRSYKKIIFFVMLLVSAIIFWFFGLRRNTGSSQHVVVWEKHEFKNGGYGYHFKTGDLTGDVVFGLKGYMVKDKTIPVKMTVSSKEEFSGLVKISVPGTSSGGVAYQSAVQCQKTIPTQLIVNIPQLGNASYFTFELLDQYGNVLLSEMEIPPYSQWISEEEDVGSQICLGILSSNVQELSALDHLTLSSEDGDVTIRTIYLDEDSFPVNADDLQMLSGLLVDDYNITRLSKKQRGVLLDWIKDGGTFMVGTGKNAFRVLDRMKEELGVSVDRVEMSRLHFGSNTQFSGEVGLYLSQLHFDENVGWRMVDWSTPASYYERNLGNGKVQMLRFSFTDESLHQWNHYDNMLKSLMEQLLCDVFEDRIDHENGIWNMEMALNDFVTSQMPNAFYYGVFFIVYLFCLTFLAYFVLRRKKKREYIWLVIPCLSLFFTLGIILRSRGNSTSSMMTQNSLSAIRIVDNESTRNDIYFLYQNAEGESKTLDFIPSIDEVKPLDYEYGQEQIDSTRVRKIKEDYTISHTMGGCQLSFTETTPGTMRILMMSENKSMNYGEKTDLFLSKLVGDHTSFQGSIANQSDKEFDKIMVIRGNQYWCGQNLKAKSSVKIAKDEVQCWPQEEEQTGLLSLEETDVAMQDMLDYLENRYLKNNTDLSDYIIIGITLKDNYQLLRGGDHLGNQVSIYVNHVFCQAPEKAECQVNINLKYLKDNQSYQELQEKLAEELNVEARYQFDSNQLIWAMARNQDDYSGEIVAYNYWTEKNDSILSKPGDVMTCEELEPYLSEMNEMKIIYKQKDIMQSNRLPILSVWLKKIARK